MQSNKTYFEELNVLGREGKAFLFIIDFEMKHPLVYPLSDIPKEILFEVPGYKQCNVPAKTPSKEIIVEKFPPSFDKYEKAFGIVQQGLNHGDTYLLNLTMPSGIETNLSLQEIFDRSRALFRLKYYEQFVCFTPEIFVRIRNGKIFSFPMKGTIDASVDNAEQKIMESAKEFAEHNTIVDLIRNDLSMVAKNVRVKRFRYIDKVQTHEGELLQVSSEISGTLPANYPENIGTVLMKLLPAGSISGAPKQRTCEIIREAEACDRGYYTGIFGMFDGKNLESAVMIRYIENQDGKLTYKSGGGITAMSDLEEEYQELINKIYVPFTGKH